MREARVTVENRLGLHARAAAQLVKLSNSFKSSIKVTRQDNSAVADGKSILSILTISASVGTRLVIEADGEDEQQAIREIKDLFSRKFGERQ
jgi:phosphotransferase system HPr (HPr) family protein